MTRTSYPTTAYTAYKIVVVEPEQNDRRFVCQQLEQASYQVVGEANNGPDMVRMVLALEPDVVVFNLRLPGLTGLDALGQICREHPLAGVALGLQQDRELIRGQLHSFHLTYIIKPFDGQQLEPAILVARARFEKDTELTEENTFLRRSLENRKLIERAKGVLMKRHRLSEGEAYRCLQRTAMDRRSSMAELSRTILDGGEVPMQNGSPARGLQATMPGMSQ